MVKVLYIVSTLKRTGPTNVLFNLINELDKNMFQPIILTLSPEEPNFPSLVDSFTELGIEIHSLHLSRISGFLLGRNKLNNFIKVNSINVVHIYGFRGDLLISRHLRNIKIVSTINSNIYDDYTMLYGKKKGAIMAYLHVLSLKNKVAVGCSEFVAKELHQRYGINLEVIYNGIPNQFYYKNSSSEKLEARISLNLPLNKKIIIYVGYLIYRKDPITVIKGFLNTKNRNDLYLLMVGDGPLMEECRQLAGEIANIKFMGNQPETLKFLKASDYYVAAAYSEGLPTSVMEAMGCGLPVVLSNMGPHRELLENVKDWNYFFETNDDCGLSLKMDAVIADDYETLSTECSDVIRNHINSKIMAEKYQKIYLKP